jgi:Spy/CpxP family protein refolding chaperone
MATKKEPKVFTLSQVSEQAYEAYWEGMANCHEITFTTMERLRNSIEDVQAVYYLGQITPKKQQMMEELQVGVDTITQLMDMFQANYDEEMDKSKAKRRREEAIANAAEFDLYK